MTELAYLEYVARAELDAEIPDPFDPAAEHQRIDPYCVWKGLRDRHQRRETVAALGPFYTGQNIRSLYAWAIGDFNLFEHQRCTGLTCRAQTKGP